MPIHFFCATESAHRQITRLFDFVWPTAAAMWNLRWQVTGYLQSAKNAKDAQLQARFTEGSNIRGANLRRACIEHTWDEQQETFARILLVNSIAIYEGWIDEILEDLGMNTTELNKAFQFPDSVAKLGKGVSWAIAEITRKESIVLRDSFHAALCQNRNYALTKLDSMFLCFRFFKELRNCDMHGGGVADQRLVDAYLRFQPVATSADLGVSEVPAHFPVSVGTRVTLSIRGVVGFSHLVLKIISTLDAELSRSELAEKVFITKWKLTNSTRVDGLEARPSRYKAKLSGLIMTAGFPEPTSLPNLGVWLKKHGLLGR